VRRLFVALVTLVVIATACADDDSGAEPADEAGADTEDAESGDDEAGSDAVNESADAEPDPPDPEPLEASGGEIETYCRLALENDQASDRFDPTTGTEATEQFVREAQASIAAAILVAPPEIRVDLATISEGVDDLAGVFEANDWDFLAALPEMEALATLPEQEAAGDRIDAWEEANCDHPVEDADEEAIGDDPPSLEDPASLDDAFASAEALEALLGSEAGRELLIDGLTENGELSRDQAACLIDNVDSPLLTALANGADPDVDLLVELLAVLDTCGISFTDFG